MKEDNRWIRLDQIMLRRPIGKRSRHSANQSSTDAVVVLANHHRAQILRRQVDAGGERCAASALVCLSGRWQLRPAARYVPPMWGSSTRPGPAAAPFTGGEHSCWHFEKLLLSSQIPRGGGTLDQKARLLTFSLLRPFYYYYRCCGSGSYPSPSGC
jgi:hypothetical protein